MSYFPEILALSVCLNCHSNKAPVTFSLCVQINLLVTLFPVILCLLLVLSLQPLRLTPRLLSKHFRADGAHGLLCAEMEEPILTMLVWDAAN